MPSLLLSTHLLLRKSQAGNSLSFAEPLTQHLQLGSRGFCLHMTGEHLGSMLNDTKTNIRVVQLEQEAV